MSTACSNSSTSKLPSSRRNFIRLSEARLQAESSTCMYSLHGLEALIRPDSGQVCQRLMIVSYWTPGSAQRQAASAIWFISSRASSVFTVEPSVRAVRCQSSPASTASMKSSLTRTELLAFWYWIEVKPSPSIDMSKPASRSASAFFSSSALHQMKCSMSGWSTSRTTIFAARRVLPPDLIVPAQESAPRMKLTGPLARAALGQLLHRAADVGEVDPRARAAAEDLALLGVPGEDRLHVVLDAEDEAGRALRALLEADVEPDRRVEGRLLVEQDRGQLGLEGVGVLVGGEVAALAPPVGDRPRDAADHLFHRGLALLGPELPAEVLLGDDVGRVLRPALGELDPALLEGRALGVADHGIADLPLDLVEGMGPGGRKSAARPRGPADRIWAVLVAVLDIELLLSRRLLGGAAQDRCRVGRTLLRATPHLPQTSLHLPLW